MIAPLHRTELRSRFFHVLCFIPDYSEIDFIDKCSMLIVDIDKVDEVNAADICFIDLVAALCTCP